jgi:hypothetical protein
MSATLCQVEDFLERFFADPVNRKYLKFRDAKAFKEVAHLISRSCRLMISSVENHGAPALQGIATELEGILSKYEDMAQDKFFISAVGSLVRYVMCVQGYAVARHSVRMKRCRYISTASTYCRI